MSRITAWLMLLLSLTIYSSAVLMPPLPATPFFDLFPTPDAPEYFATLHQLEQTGVPQIHVGGQMWPSRYPPGYPLLLLPLVECGIPAISAPFWFNRGAGILLLIFFFWIFYRRDRFLAAGLAPLLLSTLPAFLVLARSPMSEIASTLILAIAFYLLYLSTRGKWIPGLAGSFLLGLSVLLRTSFVPFLLASLLAPWLRPGQRARPRLHQSLAFGLAAALGLVPVLLYNWSQFGDPFLTGYHLWVPSVASPTSAFSFEFVPSNLHYYFLELIQQETRSSVASLYGEGSYFGPATILLILLVFHKKMSRVQLGFAGLGLFYFVLMNFYFYRDARLIFPLLVLALPLVAARLESLLAESPRDPSFDSTKRNMIPRGRFGISWRRGAVLLVVLSHLALFPGHDGDPDFDRYLRSRRLLGDPEIFLLVQHFRSLQGPGPVLLISDINPPYLFALTQGPREVFPHPGSRHDYRYNRSLEFWKPTFLRERVLQGLQRGEAVWLLLRPRPWEAPVEPFEIEGLQWRDRFRDSHGARIARLLPSASREGEGGL